MAENQRLQIARKRKHWSQTQVARLCGVDLQTYHRWERGTQVPQGYNLERLCEVFGLSEEDLGYAFEEVIQTTAVAEEAQAQQLDDQILSLIRHLTPEQVAELAPLLLGDSTMITRRNALLAVFEAAGITVMLPLSLADPEPWERLRRATTRPSAMNQDTINHFTQLLDTSRALSNGNELSIAEGLIATFLPQLQEAGRHQPEAANLAAQALQTQSILAAHRLQLTDKVLLCEKAVEFARLSGHAQTLVAALLELAVAYQYNGQPGKALQTYQEALLYCSELSPVLRARAYAELAASMATGGRKQEALFYMALAHDTLPDHPENDPSFAASDYCGHYTLSLYNGLLYIALDMPTQAYKSFEQYKTSPSSIIVPRRIELEIINNQGKAALLAGNLSEYAPLLKTGIDGALELGSKKRFDEAFNIFQQVPADWRNHAQLKPLIEQYYLTV